MEKKEQKDQYELCKLVLAIEEFFKKDGRIFEKFGLTKASRREVFHDVFKRYIPFEELKLHETFFNSCVRCVNGYEKNKVFTEKIKPYPKVIQLIYFFGIHEGTSLDGFLPFIEKYKGGKFKHLIEAARDNEVKGIASMADIYKSVEGVNQKLSEFKDFTIEEFELLKKRHEQQNKMLNRMFNELFDIVKESKDPVLLEAFGRWANDFKD